MLEPRHIFEHPTIAELAPFLTKTTINPPMPPSDFAIAPSIRQRLAESIAEHGVLQDLYPLSPVQQGMLFHAEREADHGNPGVYFHQSLFRLIGHCAVSTMRAAWSNVARRHAVLRASFHQNRLEQPLQAVQAEVSIPWTFLDWSGLSEQDRAEALVRFRRADRERGFRLDQAPLLRFALIRERPDAHLLVWSHHHLLLDGWSLPLVVGDAFAFYRAALRRRELALPDPPAFRDYIAWLTSRDLSAATAFWRERLRDFRAPTPLPTDECPDPGPAEREPQEALSLDARFGERLTRFTSEFQITASTLVQAAWSLLLRHYGGTSDLVFGATVSGRPPELPGVDAMVGLLINTLPVRVRIDESRTLIDWLKQLQTRQIEAEDHAFMPLAEMPTTLTGNQPLFESIVVFENLVPDPALLTVGVGLEIENPREFQQTNYPLTLVAVPGNPFRLRMLYEARLFRAATVRRILRHTAHLMTEILARPHQKPGRCLSSDRSRATENAPCLEHGRAGNPYLCSVTGPL